MLTEEQHYAAITDLLEYCRSPRHELGSGRLLGPVLLGDECPRTGDDWSLAHDHALAQQMTELIQSELTNARQLVGINTPVTRSPVQHGSAMRQDVEQRKNELTFWSLLWAYYICEMPHGDIGTICGWGPRNSQRLVEDGRRTYVAKKLTEIPPAGASQQQTTTQTAPSKSVGTDMRDQRSRNNRGFIFNDSVSGSTFNQFTSRKNWPDEEE